jgi:hypothetical protein
MPTSVVCILSPEERALMVNSAINIVTLLIFEIYDSELPHKFCECRSNGSWLNANYIYSIIETISTNTVTLLVLKFYDFEFSQEFFEYVGLIAVEYICNLCVLSQHKNIIIIIVIKYI